MRLQHLFLILILLFSTRVHAGNSEKKLLKKARKELSKGNYVAAKEKYIELLQLDDSNAEYLFETGLAYYNSKVEAEKSLEYFKKAKANTSDENLISELYYYLGRSNQYVGNFEEAKDNYNKFKDFLKDNNSGLVLSRDVDRFIQMCNNGLHYSKTVNKDVTIVNLDKEINSTGGEYAPVVKKDNSMLIFTGRRTESTGGKFYHDNQEYEDIYISVKEGDNWRRSTKFDSSNVYINKNINSKWHDAAVSFNDAEDKLYIYRDNHVYVSSLENEKWTDPVKMNDNVNSKKGHEPSVFITQDEQTLYVVSTDREGGVGGRDIWVAQRDGDSWGELKVVEGKINTEFDEDAPFLTADGKTMYFSSNGHTTMGGYDVFKSELQDDGTWGEPVNLGAPINTPGDDIYYIQDEEGKMGYYSSSKMGGFGGMDIYMIQLECQSIPQTEVKGILLAGDRQFPVGGEIVVYSSDGEKITTTRADSETGKYLLILKPEASYKLEVLAEKPWETDTAFEQSFTLPKQCDPFPLYQEISMHLLKDENGRDYAQEATFQNAFFNVEDSTKSYYQIPGTSNEMTDMAPDSMQYNIAGDLKFNDVLDVNEDVKIYLLNSDNDIIRVGQTGRNGQFLFRDLDPNENYIIALDEEDLKYAYYGTNPNDNGVIVKGHVEQTYRYNVKSESDIKDMPIYLFDDSKKVANVTKTDSLGNFIIDNLPEDPSVFAELNEEPFEYSIEDKSLDFTVSALIHTIDAENNEINYSEVIDLVYFDTTGSKGDDIAFENIYFDFDKHFLRSKSKQVIDKIYDYMKANPSVTIQMDGHTDWFGTDQYNQALSKRRSISAKNYLVSKGISESRITIKWFGESMPAVPNANPDGSDNADNRQLNRRVMFKVSTGNMAYMFSYN